MLNLLIPLHFTVSAHVYKPVQFQFHNVFALLFMHLYIMQLSMFKYDTTHNIIIMQFPNIEESTVCMQNFFVMKNFYIFNHREACHIVHLCK